MPLNDRQIKNAKPAAKPYKLADGSGLYLAVTPRRRQAVAAEIPQRREREITHYRQISRRFPAGSPPSR